MRKFYTLLSILFFSIVAQGQLIFHEPFNYTPDATQGLQNQSGNVWIKLNTGDSILVRAGSLSYPGLEASSGNHIAFSGAGTDYYRSFTSQNAGTVYRSFILRVDSLMTLGTTGGYFNSFVDATTTTSYGSVVWVRASQVPGKYNLGISLRSASSPITWVASDFDSLQNYFIVASYDLVSGTANDTARLWINTTGIGGTETVATAIAFGGTDLTTIGKVLVRQDNATNTPAIRLDEIRVGSNWASVTPSGTVVGASVTASTLSDFGVVTQGLSSASQSLVISGSNLTGAPGVLTVTAPQQYQVSTDNTNFSSSVTIPYTSATLASTTIYVRFVPQSPIQVNGNISIIGGGLSSPVLVAVTGTGAPLQAPVATAATSVGSSGFTANWNAVAAATNYFIDVYTMVGSSTTSTIAGWNFDTTLVKTDTADAGNSLNQNIQVISLNGSTGTISRPAGPTNNAGPNSFSISANGWDNGVDTKYWQINVNTTGATGIKLSSMQGSSNTGPKDFKIQYRVGSSGTWTDIPGGTVTMPTAVAAGNPATWGSVSELPLPAAADNQSLVSIRWTPATTTAVNGTVVASTGTSRISAIAVKGTVAGGSTPSYVIQNLSVGNVTSYNVTGLNPSTTYYYVVRASNNADTSVNSNVITVNTLAGISPSLTAFPVTNFGAQCLNSSTIDTITINGSNLTAGNISISALQGYQFSTSQAGPFSNTLSLSQTGGTFSQTVYIKFNPVQVQDYSGMISISGGGAQAIQLSINGSGVNTAPTVVTLNNGAVTINSAVLNGLLNNGGCSAISAYGFEYSTNSAFPQVSGTPVSASVTTGGNFSATITGLLPGTTYYYRAFASNSGGLGYGGIDTFTTVAPPPAILTATSVSSFGNVCVNSTISYRSFILSGTNLTAGNLTVQALPGYSYSLSQNGPFTSTLSIPQTGGTFSDTVFILFSPTAMQPYNGNINIQGGGATSLLIAVQGTGVNTPPAVVTGSFSGITSTTVTLAGTIINSGCAVPLSSYGIEYSSINNFLSGTGISVPANNNVGGFTVTIDSLVPGATYYYRAYASNGNTIGYGALASFTTNAIGSGLVVGPNPIAVGGQIHVSIGGLQPGYHAIVLTNTSGMQVYSKPLNITGSFINETFNLPMSIASGTYVLSVMNGSGVVESKLLVIL